MNLRDAAIAYVAMRACQRAVFTGDALEEAARDITRLSPTPCATLNAEGHVITFDWFFTDEDMPEIVSFAEAVARAQASANPG